jgi:hypothetical protein
MIYYLRTQRLNRVYICKKESITYTRHHLSGILRRLQKKNYRTGCVTGMSGMSLRDKTLRIAVVQNLRDTLRKIGYAQSAMRSVHENPVFIRPSAQRMHV